MTRASRSSMGQPAPDLTGVSGVPLICTGYSVAAILFASSPTFRCPLGYHPPWIDDIVSSTAQRKTDSMSNVEPTSSLPKRPAAVRHPSLRVMSVCQEATPPGAPQAVAELLVATLAVQSLREHHLLPPLTLL